MNKGLRNQLCIKCSRLPKDHRIDRTSCTYRPGGGQVEADDPLAGLSALIAAKRKRDAQLSDPS